jgi:mRNA interferase MazF
MNRRGDVILVPIDFTNRAGSKIRPAIVVSDADYNRRPDRIIISVTSNLGTLPHPGDHVLVHWQAAGLKAPSLAQMKLSTVEASIIRRTVGRLHPNDLAAVNRGLAEALGLTLAAAPP